MCGCYCDVTDCRYLSTHVVSTVVYFPYFMLIDALNMNETAAASMHLHFTAARRRHSYLLLTEVPLYIQTSVCSQVPRARRLATTLLPFGAFLLLLPLCCLLPAAVAASRLLYLLMSFLPSCVAVLTSFLPPCLVDFFLTLWLLQWTAAAGIRVGTYYL